MLQPGRNAGMLWVRELEGCFNVATVRVYLVGAKVLYAALRWFGTTDAVPFADVKVAVDKTPSWEKRDAYCKTEVHWLERCSGGATLLVILLGAHAGLRASEMTALKWDDMNLGEGVLRVVVGKGGKSARVYLTPTLVQALEATPLDQRNDYVLPCRSRQAVYGRLEAACRQARAAFKGVHALRRASGTRLREATCDLALVADHLRHSSLDTARGYVKADNGQLGRALSESLKKNGKAPNGKQRYHCKDCNRASLESPDYGRSEERKETIPKAYQERSSMRGIARTSGISPDTLSTWFKKAETTPPLHETLFSPKTFEAVLLELYELWSFVKAKSCKRWVWLALCKQKRQVVVCVVGGRGIDACKKLWGNVPGFTNKASCSATSGRLIRL